MLLVQVITERGLRDDVSRLLREVEAGERFREGLNKLAKRQIGRRPGFGGGSVGNLQRRVAEGLSRDTIDTA